MKRIILFVFVIGCSLLMIQDVKAQDQVTFKDHLWYGSHASLGFAASSNESQLLLGLAPMVGYKIIEPLSVGVRGNLAYNRISFDYGSKQVFNTVDLGIGSFVRGQVYGQYFVQMDLMYESLEVLINNSESKINGMNAYIGVGMNARDGNPSFEAMLTYDFFLHDNRHDNIYKSNLIGARFGITYRY